MIFLELFSGNGDLSSEITRRGGAAYKVDWAKDVGPDLCADVATLTVGDIVGLCGQVPNVVWASPQCTTYSIATHRHRTLKDGLYPKTELAKHDDNVNRKMWALIDDLMVAGTTLYFVENPRGRMRHMDFIAGRPRFTVTYGSYGCQFSKPTDIWTNHPNPRFLSKTFKSSVSWRYSKKDVLERSRIPNKLVKHFCDLFYEYDKIVEMSPKRP